MVFLEIFISAIIFVILLLCFGFVFTFIRNQNIKNMQIVFGEKGYLIFSFIGVPIHELSHYIACKLFLHKVTKVELFSPKKWKLTGQMGCVEHSFNPKKIYQLAGNFIIGVAPIISSVLFSYLIVNFVGVKNIIPNIENMSFLETFSHIKDIFVGIISIFSFSNLSNPLFWIGMFLLINIFLHVSISKADLKNALVGMLFFIFFIPFLSVLLMFVSISPSSFLSVCVKTNYLFLIMLIVGLIINIFIFLVSSILRIVKK